MAFIDVLLGRVADAARTRPGAVQMLESGGEELRRSGSTPTPSFAQALIAEAEALSGDRAAALEIARGELETVTGSVRCSSGPPGSPWPGLAGRRAKEQLLGARRRRERGAATRSPRRSMRWRVGRADDGLGRERDEIMEGLKIERLPAPALRPS